MGQLTNFVPSNKTEWILTILVFVLLITVFLYNKAILKCKDLIEQYVFEIKELKQEKKEYYSSLVLDDSTGEVLDNV